MKKQLKDFFRFSILLNIATVLLGIVTYRILGPTEVGHLNIVMQIIMAVSMITTLSLPDMLARYLPSMKESDKDSVFKTNLLISYIFILFLTLIYILLNTFGTIVLPKEIQNISIFIILTIIIQTSINHVFGYLKGTGHFISYLKYEGSINALSRLIGICVFVLYYQSFESIYFMQLLILTIVLLIFMIRMNFLFTPFSIKITKKMINYTAVLFAGSLVYIGSNTIDVFAIRYYLDAEHVGLFTAAIMIPKTMQTVFLSKLQVPFLYYFSSNNTKINNEDILEKGTLVIGSLTGIIALLIMYQSKNIIYYIYGVQYIDSMIILQTFSIHFFLVGLLIFSGVYFNAKEKPSLALYIGLVGLIVNIILDITLLPTYGIMGAAIAHVVGLIIQVIIYIIFLRIHKIKINKIISLFIIILSIYVVNIFNENLFFILFILMLVSLIFFRLLDIKFIVNFLKKPSSKE